MEPSPDGKDWLDFKAATSSAGTENSNSRHTAGFEVQGEPVTLKCTGGFTACDFSGAVGI